MRTTAPGTGPSGPVTDPARMASPNSARVVVVRPVSGWRTVRDRSTEVVVCSTSVLDVDDGGGRMPRSGALDVPPKPTVTLPTPRPVTTRRPGSRPPASKGGAYGRHGAVTFKTGSSRNT